MKVSDAMTPEVQLCTPDDTLKEAAQAMAALGVGLLPVTDNERLVGMISDRDIAIRGIGMGRGPDARIGDVMTADVRYCYEDQNLDEVSAIMGDIQVRRLPVLNRDKRLVGIIALGDIALVQGGNGTSAALRGISRPRRAACTTLVVSSREYRAPASCGNAGTQSYTKGECRCADNGIRASVPTSTGSELFFGAGSGIVHAGRTAGLHFAGRGSRRRSLLRVRVLGRAFGRAVVGVWLA